MNQPDPNQPAGNSPTTPPPAAAPAAGHPLRRITPSRTPIRSILTTALVIIAILVLLFVLKPWKWASDGVADSGIPSASEAAQNQIADLKRQLEEAKRQPAMPQTVIIPSGDGRVTEQFGGRRAVGQDPTANNGRVNGPENATVEWIPTECFGGRHIVEARWRGADPRQFPGFVAWGHAFEAKANNMLVSGKKPVDVVAYYRSEARKNFPSLRGIGYLRVDGQDWGAPVARGEVARRATRR